MKIAAVTCHPDPESLRARQIRVGLKADKRIRLTVIKNHYSGWLRYPEVVWKLINLRLQQDPAVYVVTYKSLAILPVVLWLAGNRAVVYDEFSVPLLLTDSDLPTRTAREATRYFLVQFAKPLYQRALRQCRYILAGTEAQTELSARTNHVNLRQYLVAPLGADEQIFKPSQLIKNERINLPFKVCFFCQDIGTSELAVVLSTIEDLKDKPEISFTLIGGTKLVARTVQAAQDRGANLIYQPNVTNVEWSLAINASALVLAGPFDNGSAGRYQISYKTYLSLACATATVIGQNRISETIFTDKDNSLLVAPGDSAALTETINWAYRNRSELVDIGRNGRKLYERMFSEDCLKSEISEMVDELIVSD